MPKTRTTSLVTETTDDIATKTYRTPDEKEYAREKKRKNVRFGDQPIPENGSCCDRCRNYRPAMEGETFGICRQLGVVVERVGRYEKGDVVDRLKQRNTPTEPLHGKPWAGQGCSAYVDVAEVIAA